MKPLFINKTDDSPQINFNSEKGIFEIIGRLIPEDPVKFFQPAITWMEQYITQPNQETTLNLTIEYINTSSSKSLEKIFKILEDLNQNEGNVRVRWYFVDEDMLEAASDYESVINIPFEKININRY